MDIELSLSPEIDACIENAVSGGVTPGAVLVVSSGGEVVHSRAYGLAQRLPDPRPMRLNTLFDVSSLTKVMATTAAVMSLIDAGKMTLEDRVSKHVPDFTGPGRDRVSISDLLIHGSGLPAHRPFYREILEKAAAGGPQPGTPEARAYVMAEVRRSALAQRVGEGAVYSDLGFILLTEAIENVTGSRLDAFVHDHIHQHLELHRTFFIPLGERPRRGLQAASFAATEFSPWLERYLVGEVHDDNAHVMGGVSGHAGLFSCAADVLAFGQTLLRAFHGERGLIYSPEVMRDFWRRRVFPNGTMRAYGWDIPAPEGSAAGRFFSDLSFGHLGFTGTSIWIDAAREIVVVLLTNRVHPTHENDRIRALRPAVHDLIMETLLADRFRPRSREEAYKIEDEDEWNVGAASLMGTGSGQTSSTPRWILTTYSRGVPGAALPPPPRVKLNAIWFKCKACREIMYRPELEKNLMVCPNCQHHHYLPCLKRVALLADEGSFEELDEGISPADPLQFFDSRGYKDRLKVVQKKLGVKDAFRSGRCRIGGRPAHIGVFDFGFMGGSMGSVVGEKVTRVFERALEERTGAVVVSASGGARMQEGVLSLMQMAKSCAALARLRQAGLPYISIMCHPTTGGVAASFAMLGDVNIAEPEALIGFAGPRVIEQTIRQKLPEGFQRSEYLLEHGMLDLIVARKQMRETVRNLYSMLID